MKQIPSKHILTHRVLKEMLYCLAGVILFLGNASLSEAQNEAPEHNQSIEGGRGLMYMQSAETFGKGALTAGLAGFTMSKEVSVAETGGILRDKHDLPTVLALPVTFGLTEEVDLSAALYGYYDGRSWLDPYRAHDGYGDTDSGIGSARFGAKIRVPLPDKLPITVAGRFTAVFSSSGKQLEEMNYRWTRTDTDIESSLYETLRIGRNIRMHLEQGYVLSGTDYYDDQVVLNGGIDINIKPWWNVSCEMLSRTFRGKSPRSIIKNSGDYVRQIGITGTALGDPAFLLDDEYKFNEDMLYLAPSMRFRLNRIMSCYFGGLINIADHDEPKEQFQIIAGVTFGTKLLAIIDTDHDGVRNNIDVEPSTPRGYPVDQNGRALDSDLDGVPDGLDLEGNTPVGARINERGVGIDTDGDGIFDGIDLEVDTPRGCPVDRFGVALDGDRDGVPDGLDLEQNTIIGAIVGKDGIALDDDGDGVPNGLDLQEDTVKDAIVDESGVAYDDDNDGVPNGIDKEPNTPEGLLVDKTGRALIRQDYSLFREGLIRLNTITYEGGSTDVPEDSMHVLNEIGRIMMKYPALKIQIEGHTDSTGDPAFNLRIARERAFKVLEEIVKRFPELSRDRLRAVGFGSDKPLASNNTIQGRQANRRVEFVILENGK